MNANEEQNCLSESISSLTQTLVHFLFLASLYSAGPAQTATLRCSVQPSRDERKSQSTPATPGHSTGHCLFEQGGEGQNSESH